MGKISLLNSLYSRYFLWLSWNWPRDCEIVHCGSPSWYVSRFSSMFPYFRKSRDRSRELPDWGNRICKTLPNTSQDCYDSISMLKCQNADFRKIRKKSKKMKNVFIENRFFQNWALRLRNIERGMFSTEKFGYSRWQVQRWKEETKKGPKSVKCEKSEKAEYFSTSTS